VSELAIETTRLRKEYGAKTAVADLSLSVPRGEVFGFLGPNGAGKSTSIKMLLGLVRPTSGVARVLGRAPGDIAALGHIGFLPEHFRFHEWLTATELLRLHGRLYRMDPKVCRTRAAEALELVGLGEHANQPLSSFSKGMFQRIGLAQALFHAPELVFLDEPTSALDPFGRRLVRTIIQQVKAQGTTVFLNSHLLSEVEVTCDRVAFIRDGAVLRTVVLRELTSEAQQLELRVDAVTPALLERLERVTLEWRLGDDERAGVSSGGAWPRPSRCADTGGETHELPQTLDLVVRPEQIPLIAEEALTAGARIYALTPRRTSLEQLFLDIVGSEDSGQ
jgi:ABC-2 type transport system ATP-binding protein